MLTRRIPIFLVALIVAIAVVNGFADKYYWYWQMRWFDMPMHFSGGVFLAGVVFWWYYNREGEPFDGNFLKVITICLSAALGVGIAWEIFEAIVGLMTVGHINAMSDTLSDLFFDTLGGIAVAVWGWQKLNKKIYDAT